MTAILVNQVIFTMIIDVSQLVLMVFTEMLSHGHENLATLPVQDDLDPIQRSALSVIIQNSTYFQENQSEHWQLV